MRPISRSKDKISDLSTVRRSEGCVGSSGSCSIKSGSISSGLVSILEPIGAGGGNGPSPISCAAAGAAVKASTVKARTVLFFIKSNA